MTPRRLLFLLGISALALTACAPAAQVKPDAAAPAAAPTTALPTIPFKLSVTVLDAETGRPIPDAWVLIAVRAGTDRPAPGGELEAVAGARAITGADGAARIAEVAGTYYPGQPKTKAWLLMESARAERLGPRKLIGLEGGSIVVASPKYGFLHQPFAVEDSPSFRKWLERNAGKVKEDYGGWIGRKFVRETLKPLFVRSEDLATGITITLKMRRPGSLDEWAKTISLEAFSDATWGPMSVDAGASEEEQRRLYAMFAFEMGGIARKTGKDEHWLDFFAYLRDEARKFYVGHRPDDLNQDAAIQVWLVQKALAILPREHEEVKQYANAILKGVADEGKDLRWRNHYSAPSDPAERLPAADTALQWAGLDADNPRNEWDWQDAQRYYREGDRQKAYEALGHVLRLLVNLSIPKYTRLEPRTEDPFEQEVLRLMERNGGQLPPEYWWETKGPTFAKTPQARFDAIARATAKGVEGNLVAESPFGPIINGHSDSAWKAIAERGFPLAIAQAAGLLRDFHRLVNPARFVQAPGGGNGNRGKGSPRYDTRVSSSSELRTSEMPSWKEDVVIKDGVERVRVFQKYGHQQVEFLSPKGETIKEWDEGFTAISGDGSKVLLVSTKKDGIACSAQLTLADIEGRTVWRLDAPFSCNRFFLVANSGAVAIGPTLGNSTWDLISTDSKSLKTISLPWTRSGFRVAWSAHGRGLLISPFRGNQLFCASQSAEVIYSTKIKPPGTSAQQIVRQFVRDDCSAVVATTPSRDSDDKEGRLLFIALTGNIQASRKLDALPRLNGSFQASANGRFLAFVRPPRQIFVINSDTLEETSTFAIPQDEGISSIAPLNSGRGAVVLCRDRKSDQMIYGKDEWPKVRERMIRVYSNGKERGRGRKIILPGQGRGFLRRAVLTDDDTRIQIYSQDGLKILPLDD